MPIRSVLVAEDDATTAAVLLDLLADEGFAVSHARDGVAALAAIARDPPDVLVTDVRMPRMDGVELARRAIARTPPIPVVLVGAHLGRAGVPGAVFVAKPFDLDHLVDLIRRLAKGDPP